ncbi:GntR family transcriptional regulator [Arthrobacter sp. RIT-PI-e]|uniref:GntR family transcriptional regulator n=1 Tax=Arthrobacter sp. RIT-PI-e TaxID=1681197 RepID=UPI0006768F33|nr:GntR family transcriptional regulator [Arthrobacter sp. RIT-PI-e]KNC20198.1 GntR family transcriptional regulator [Arthrobacter sp. RIT-PI-e]
MGKTAGAALSGREKAYAYLRENVLTDASMQGRFLNEQALAERIGVSRTPIREAFLLLVADGLVELIPQRGAYIPVVSARQISELMDLRGVIESHAARASIAAGQPPLAGMQHILAQQAALPDPLTGSAVKEFIRLDALFHQELVDAARNELMSQTYRKLQVRQVLVGVEALIKVEGRREQVCAEHQRIIDALADGDADAAIHEHLAVTRDILLRT